MGALPESNLPGHENLFQRIVAAFEVLQESRNVDFKRTQSWPEIKKGCVKDILAMGNTRDGGIIVIGVDESNETWETTGVTEQDVGSYDPDEMLDFVNKYASPPMNFDVVKHNGDEKRIFVIIHVHEFSGIPIVCRKSSEELRRGAVYIRPLGKAESREVQNADEMRTLIDMATDKSGRALLTRLRGLGLLVSAKVPEAHGVLTNDQQRFNNELEGL